MKNWIKIFAAIASMTFASYVSAAESQPLDLGYRSDGMGEIDFTANSNAVVRLYSNGNLVFACDTYGVLYAASGVSWIQNGSYFTVGIPEGYYTATLDVSGSNDYNVGPGNYISWSGGSGGYVTVEFWNF